MIKLFIAILIKIMINILISDYLTNLHKITNKIFSKQVFLTIIKMKKYLTVVILYKIQILCLRSLTRRKTTFSYKITMNTSSKFKN